MDSSSTRQRLKEITTFAGSSYEIYAHLEWKILTISTPGDEMRDSDWPTAIQYLSGTVFDKGVARYPLIFSQDENIMDI